MSRDEQLAALVRNFEPTFAAIQLEKGDNNTPHLQGMFWSKRQWRYSTIISRLPGCHITPITNGLRGALRAWEYCQKSATQIEPPITHGEIPVPQAKETAKERTKRENKEILESGIIPAVKEGLIKIASYTTARNSLNNFRLDSHPPYIAPDVRGLWIYGPPGTGKSHTARTRYPNAYIKAQNKWWDGYDGHEQVILDDLDTHHLNHYLKIWADKWPCTGESKGGTLPLRHRKFVVTSNYEPEDLS